MVATWEVNSNIFQQNVQRVIGDYNVMAVVKNNAYNYGLEFAVNQFLKAGISTFSTTSLNEAIRVRQLAPDATIFLMNPSIEFEKLRAHDIHMTLPSLSFYHQYKSELHDIHVHVEYENLLHRSGFKTLDEILSVLVEHFSDVDSKMKVSGLWTHFGYADEFDGPEYEKELQDWMNIVDTLLEKGYQFEMIHAQNSASFMRESKVLNHHTHVRIGIALYGSRPYSSLSRDTIQQSLRVKANVIQIREVNENDYCGYSFAFKAKHDHTRLAVVDIGYGDGILRTRAQHEVSIKGRKYPIRALMMSHMFVEVDENVASTDEVIIYDNDLRIDDYTFKGVGANSEQLSALNLDSLKKEYV
ncbi:alanine racemase [Staphylococcus canis]|uniref:Alanine racemase n=1 Tax=Staphylococcus canis TaxID=2724942 RepID=A0ABS0T9N0_9STAP|nr:alanine racemase [Staphylococcus canis]MBI5975445.1 alanine racemase [Staphylococcus canis]